jgi:cytoskeletal protein CcmA (bactofilin family)
VLAGARVRRRGRVSGRVVEGTPRIALPALPTAAQAQALADRSFDHDMTFTDAVFDDVVFVAGDVRIRGSLDGAGTIIARGSIRLEKPRQAARLEPAAGTRLSLVALGSVHLEAGRSVRGVVVAGRDIELEWQNRFEGVLVAHRDIEVEEASSVTFAALDRLSAARVTTAGFTFTPASPLAEGAHVVAVALRDRAGNLAHARRSFTTTGARQPR